MSKWVTENGTEILVSDMSDRHLKNAFAMVELKIERELETLAHAPDHFNNVKSEWLHQCRRLLSAELETRAINASEDKNETLL